MDRNRVRGSLHEMKGAAKQAIGEATGNTKWVAEGKIEQIAGKFQKSLGVMNTALRNAIRKL